MMKLGRPSYTSCHYSLWLDRLEPFLKQGRSLRNAIDCAGLTVHKNVLYKHYNDNKEFRDKIDYFLGYVGELINEVVARQVKVMHDKVLNDVPLANIEVKILIFCAKHYRPCEPFFIQDNKKTRRHNPFRIDHVKTLTKLLNSLA